MRAAGAMSTMDVSPKPPSFTGSRTWLRARERSARVASRWHEKWKDLGEDYDNGLRREKYSHLCRSCEEAKSRWTLLGFEEPDIASLNRTVPTLGTEDAPMALQLMAALKAPAFTADVASAFATKSRLGACF